METVERSGGGVNAELARRACEIVKAAGTAGATARVAGGVAIALACPSARAGPLKRPYGDIDLVVRQRQVKALEAAVRELGYDGEGQFNAIHGAERRMYWHRESRQHLDVFVDRLKMCHEIPLADRLEIRPQTLSLADLLLTKLQVVETTEKDVQDILALLVDHPLTGDESGVNVDYVADLCARDWGLWRTATLTIDRTLAAAEKLAMTALGSLDAVAQLRALRERLESAPKSRAWRLRARVGERVRWYELPEEPWGQ